jgi:hypothetical protein
LWFLGNYIRFLDFVVTRKNNIVVDSSKKKRTVVVVVVDVERSVDGGDFCFVFVVDFDFVVVVENKEREIEKKN